MGRQQANGKDLSRESIAKTIWFRFRNYYSEYGFRWCFFVIPLGNPDNYCLGYLMVMMELHQTTSHDHQEMPVVFHMFWNLPFSIFQKLHNFNTVFSLLSSNLQVTLHINNIARRVSVNGQRQLQRTQNGNRWTNKLKRNPQIRAFQLLTHCTILQFDELY